MDKFKLGLVVVACIETILKTIVRPSDAGVAGVQFSDGTHVEFIVRAKCPGDDIAKGLDAIEDNRLGDITAVSVIIRECVLSDMIGEGNDIDVPMTVGKDTLDKVFNLK